MRVWPHVCYQRSVTVGTDREDKGCEIQLFDLRKVRRGPFAQSRADVALPGQSLRVHVAWPAR